jgi:transcriptional regulator with XRE-family HTH domain
MEPDFEKLLLLSEYFNVSLDYLLAKTTLDDNLSNIKRLYNQLNYENKIKIKERIHTLLEEQK